MIFNEIYGCYYNAVAKIIGLAVEGKLTERELHRIVSESTFNESMLSLIPAIKQQKWQLIDENYNTSIKAEPVMPLTILEKRWLKTISLDSRMVLFDISAQELQDIEPLFLPSDIVYFDRYLDGDPYDDPAYKINFRTVMQAIRERRKVKIRYLNSRGIEKHGTFAPIKMEYSDKEDKFRVLSAGTHDTRTVNIGRILQCELLEEVFSADLQLPERARETLTFELTDERNTLERVMMKFAHYKKQVERLDENTYRAEVEYDKEDETDLVIQIMTFGRFVKVTGPETIKKDIAKRIAKQLTRMEW